MPQKRARVDRCQQQLLLQICNIIILSGLKDTQRAGRGEPVCFGGEGWVAAACLEEPHFCEQANEGGATRSTLVPSGNGGTGRLALGLMELVVDHQLRGSRSGAGKE